MKHPRSTSWPVCAVAMCAAGAVLAEIPPLSGEAIRESIGGATVHLDTPLGVVLPVVFREDGTMTGTAGRLAFYLGAAADRGRWWVSGGKLCTRWSRWFDSEPSCMQIRRFGARFEWRRDDGKSGTAIIAHRAPPRPAAPPPVIQAAPTTVPAAPVIVAEAVAPAPAPAPPGDALSAPVLLVHPQLQREVAVAPARPDPPPAAAAEPTAQLQLQPSPRTPLSVFRVVGVDAGDVLNVRAQPFPDAPILAAIPSNGRGVRRLGPCHGWWCLVDFRARSGWVNAIYLKPEASGARGP